MVYAGHCRKRGSGRHYSAAWSAKVPAPWPCALKSSVPNVSSLATRPALWWGNPAAASAAPWTTTGRCRTCRASCRAATPYIHFRGGEYFLEDTSTNGTYVNDSVAPLGKRGSRVLLHAGDVLRMGEYRILVHIDERPRPQCARRIPRPWRT